MCETDKFVPWKGADIHHIDSNKFNLAYSNLISLCRTCHKFIQWHMDEYTPLIYAILSERHGYIYPCV